MNTKESDKKRSQMSCDAVPVSLGGNCLLCFNGSKYINCWYPLFTPLKWSSFHSATSGVRYQQNGHCHSELSHLNHLLPLQKIYIYISLKKRKKNHSLQLSRKIRFITTDFCYDPKWPRKTQIVIKILFQHIFVFLAF